MLEINGRNYCEHCFAELNSNAGKCPFCTYPKNNEKYPTALTEGTILAGRYVVGRVLGKGGFGVTYLCYDSKDRTRVAIKEYLPDSLTHRNTGETQVSTYGGESEEYFKTGAQKFYDEAKLVSRFNGNPNIISVYEFFYENNTTYFVMEYLDGTDLKHYIKEKGGKISEEETLYIAQKVAEALMIVHSTDVLHRDISPDNIFLCSDGKVKLIDFGAARQVVGEASKSLSVILKQGFAPLEQYQKRGKQGPWTDIYALGASLYYALTGEVLDDAMSRIADDELNLESITPGFAAILQKMLEIKIEERYQNTFELKTALSELPITPKPIEIKSLEKTAESVAVTEESDDVKVTVIVKDDNKIAEEKKKEFDVRAILEKVKTSIDFKDKKTLIPISSVAVLILVVIIAVVAFSGKEDIKVDEDSGGKYSQTGTYAHTVGPFESLTEAMKTSLTQAIETVASETTTATTKAPTTKKPTTKKPTTRKPTTTKPPKLSFSNKYKTIAAGTANSAAIKTDGTVYWIGYRYSGENVSGWKNIIDIDAGSYYVVGLKSDGTVVATGQNTDGECNVSGWKNIVSVSAGDSHTVGLKSDGTVVATGKNDGSLWIKGGCCDVSGWRNIIAVDAGDYHTVGLKSDGTVVATGDNTYGQCNVSGWENIVAVAAGQYTSFGIKSDGTVVAAGINSNGECSVSGWRNIVAIAADTNTIGLKSDGTVIATGSNSYNECDVSGWKNIVAIAAGQNHTLGLKSDGTLVATGFDSNDVCDVSDWKNIRNPKFTGIG